MLLFAHLSWKAPSEIRQSNKISWNKYDINATAQSTEQKQMEFFVVLFWKSTLSYF